ncbi:MAG: hypothetical protein AB2693_19350, partial [Candidatus Thiodiazotropha sp.]
LKVFFCCCCSIFSSADHLCQVSGGWGREKEEIFDSGHFRDVHMKKIQILPTKSVLTFLRRSLLKKDMIAKVDGRRTDVRPTGKGRPQYLTLSISCSGAMKIRNSNDIQNKNM